MRMTEGNLSFDFEAAKSARKFDDSSHDLSHCMKAVDFIVEENNRLLFIEVKDPDHPDAQAENREEFIAAFKSGRLIPDLVGKYRDSLLYEYVHERVGKKPAKPVVYVVLIAMDSLDAAQILHQADQLRRRLPVVDSPSSPWRKRFVENCLLVNLDSWTKHFKQYPVSRKSS